MSERNIQCCHIVSWKNIESDKRLQRREPQFLDNSWLSRTKSPRRKVSGLIHETRRHLKKARGKKVLCTTSAW